MPDRTLPIHAQWSLPVSELEWRATRSRGPGGQNVNKVNSKVELRWSLRKSRSIPEELRTRLITRAGAVLTEKGEIVVTSDRSRSQSANRKDATDRLVSLLRRLLMDRRRRKPTRPGKGAIERRLVAKKKLHAKKAGRHLSRRPREDDE